MSKKHPLTERELRDKLIQKLVALKRFELLHMISFEKRKEFMRLIELIEQQLRVDVHFEYPTELANLIDSFLTKTAPFQAIAEESKMLDALWQYHENLSVNLSEIWESTDKSFDSLVLYPEKFTPKSGGAKMGGERTGVYTFHKGHDKETMLIKQGANVGETIAEYIGANLYGLTLPENSAQCLLMKDKSKGNGTIDDVYVASIYEKADPGKPPQDAFKAAGYPSRTFFDGLKARFAKFLGIQDSLVRKVIKIDQEETDHSLAQCAASVLWHGDNDFHTGNFLLIEKDGKKKFSKIDHGFSFFDFKKDVVNINNPFGGKVFNVSFSRALKGGKFVEFYPTNHFWDFAVESQNFYYNDKFITACDEICALTPAQIQANLHQSIQNVIQIYGPQHAEEALRGFANRIGMTTQDINLQFTNPDTDLIAFNIEKYMTQRLIERQKSIEKIANHCREQSKLLTPERRQISALLGNQIINLLDVVTTLKQQEKTDYNRHAKQSLKKEIGFLKMLQQANDLGLLKNENNKFTLSRNFYLHNQGKHELITPALFQERLSHIIPRKTASKKDQKEDEISLSDNSLKHIEKIHHMNLAGEKPTPRPKATR